MRWPPAQPQSQRDSSAHILERAAEAHHHLVAREDDRVDLSLERLLELGLIMARPDVGPDHDLILHIGAAQAGQAGAHLHIGHRADRHAALRRG
ncbi:hypothetical protein K2Z83_03075, partial [Oscillochloris sp. ZM17-4]